MPLGGYGDGDQRSNPNMPNNTVAIKVSRPMVMLTAPAELAERIFALRKDDRFVRCSYSGLIRQLAEMGLSLLDTERTQDSA